MLQFKSLQKLALALLLIALAVLTEPRVATSQSSSQLLSGPSVDELMFLFEPTPEAQMAALKAKQVDMITGIPNFKALANLSADRNVRVYNSSDGSARMAFLVFNTRRSPFDDVMFRRAVSCLIDRELLARTILQGVAVPLETYIPKAFHDWISQNATACKFNQSKAIEILRSAGYDYNSESSRWLKTTDSGTRSQLGQMTILTPQLQEAVGLWATGNYTASLLQNLGFQVRHVALTEDELLMRIVQGRDFDMAVYDQDLWPAPFKLYSLLDSALDKPPSQTYSGIHDSTLDRALESLWFGMSRGEVLKAAQDAQRRLVDLVPYVPVYSVYSIAAASSDWDGFVNVLGYGVVNEYTYTGVHKIGKPVGGRFVQAQREVTTLNPLTANSWQELNILQQLYSPLLAFDPETLEERPVLARRWQIEPWTATDKKGMKITFTLKDGVVWQDGEPFTAEDVKFCIEYLQANKIPQYQNIWKNLAKVEAPNRTSVQIYLNEPGYRYVHEFADMTFLPAHIWKDVKDYEAFKPWEEPHPTVRGLTKLIGQGPFIFAQGDFKKSLRLVWNPMYFGKNPQKPGLLERQTGPLNASAGQPINVQYEVLNHTRGIVSDPQATFRLIVRKGDKILLDIPTSYSNGLYTASIDTGKIGAGEYVCEFNAAPYGLDTFTLTVEESPVIMQSSWIFMSVGVVAAVAVMAVVILRKRGIRKNSLGSDAKT